MKFRLLLLTTFIAFGNSSGQASDLTERIKAHYDDELATLFTYFHQNPELSMAEHKTAERLANELTTLGMEVTTGVGETGVVALFKNGEGPTVLIRGDMDGLPVKEQSGLDYASSATQKDPFTGKVVPVMHACGHDVHVTSLVGTAKQLIRLKETWSGTLMLIGQPAEERIMGARKMREDNLYQRFGYPDFGLAFHVSSELPAGFLSVSGGPLSAGSDSVDIIVHGEGSHGASPHLGKDPIVLASQIVLALQTLVSRELPPRDSGVITVGAFNAGLKHNVIPDKAHLQLTVRNLNPESRALLLNGIKRISVNLGKAAGLADEKLPEVIISKEQSTPPVTNNVALSETLEQLFIEAFGEDQLVSNNNKGMGAEDFGYFTTAPDIPAVYFSVGGASKADMESAREKGRSQIPHHSPFFRIEPEPSIIRGVEASVLAALKLFDSGID